MKNHSFVQDKTGKYLTLEPVCKEEIINLAYSLIVPDFVNNTVISSPVDCVEFLKLALFDQGREKFGVVYLTCRHQVIAFEILFEGNINGASVHPRVVAKACLRHNASAVILSHNHPSCQTAPSQADRDVTRKIADSLKLIDVRVLDHLIVGGDGYTSLSEFGYM